jgi:Relaxase/Mobilisation nuclease domain
LISNITKGSNFGGLLRYLLHESKQPQIVAPYMLGDNASDLAREFDQIANLRPTTQLPVRHISLSFAPSDDGKVSDSDKEAIVVRVVAEMGYEDCQFIGIAHHRDDPGHDLPHDHEHLHIVVNAVNLYGERVSDSWDRFKIQPILREIERDFGLEPVKNSWEVGRDRSVQAQQQIPTDISQLVDQSLENCPNLETWIDRLQESQIDVRFALRKDNKVNGVTYLQGGKAYKGSEIGANWNAVEQRVLTSSDSLPLIRAANAKSQEHRMDLGAIERQNFNRAAVMANMALKGRERVKTGRLDIKRDGNTLTAYRMRPHCQILKAIETERGWEPVGYPNIDRVDLNLLMKLSGYQDEPAPIPDKFGSLLSGEQLEPQAEADDYIDRSPELAPSHSIPVTLKQIIDLKNYYVKSPEGRTKPESVDARSKFDIYKFQISQHGKAVTGDPNLKLTNQFFKTFESQQVTLSLADRANLDAASAFASEQAQIALEIAQASSLEPKQRSRGFSR